MGWGTYENHEGRQCGYCVSATCDHPGCGAKIDRGLSYLCGTQEAISGGGPGCGGYFCTNHLTDAGRATNGQFAQLCPACMDDPDNADYFPKGNNDE